MMRRHTADGNTKRFVVTVLRRAGWLLAVPLLLAMTALASTGSTSYASGTALNGPWAPFSRCPVDDGAMLAVDGRNAISQCIASSAASGSIKLGNTTATSGSTEIQFGLVEPSIGPINAISPVGGAIMGAPVNVPGGVLGLMCPSSNPLVAGVCAAATNNALNNVTATVESAGAPSDINIAAATQVGVPLLTLPIKVHLQNPLLGSRCYIGSDSDPIVLHPANIDISHSKITFGRFNPDGSTNPNGELSEFGLSGVTQGDSTFAVPGASGCGIGGLLNSTINSKVGLPSASGNNNIVLNAAGTIQVGLATAGAFFPNAGTELSKDWHAGATAPVSAPNANTGGLLPVRLRLTLGW